MSQALVANGHIVKVFAVGGLHNPIPIPFMMVPPLWSISHLAGYTYARIGNHTATIMEDNVHKCRKKSSQARIC